MTKNKQLAINMSASIIAFAVNMGISFFLSPYIIKNVGVEAFGFVSLGNNFIQYASLIAIALNSMAGRFITIKYHQNDMEAVKIYFNSVIIANMAIAGFMFIPMCFCVIFLEKFVDIPAHIIGDVKILFAFLFINFLIGVIGATYSVAMFVKNKLYINSMRTIESNGIRAVSILFLFFCFVPRVSFVGFSAFLSAVYVIIFNIIYQKKLLPELKFNLKYYKFKSILEIASAGIWNVLTKLGQILLDGLDLIITNIFIDAQAMGVLAIVKTIPTLISGIIGTMVTAFAPNFTIEYAKGNTNELIKSIKQSMKILSLFTNIPIAILISMGYEFFALWVPTQNAGQLQILSIVTISGYIISGSINSIYNIFTVTNKLKTNSLLLLGTGVLSTLTVFTLLKTTNFGLYAVAGISAIFGIIRNLLFTIPFGAIYLKQKWYTFYFVVIRSVIGLGFTVIIGYLSKMFININSWTFLTIAVVITVGTGLLCNIFFLLDKTERKYLLTKIKIIKSRE